MNTLPPVDLVALALPYLSSTGAPAPPVCPPVLSDLSTSPLVASLWYSWPELEALPSTMWQSFLQDHLPTLCHTVQVIGLLLAIPVALGILLFVLACFDFSTTTPPLPPRLVDEE